MFKNILKSVAWISLYFATSIIGSIIAVIIYLLFGIIPIPDNIDNPNILMDFTMELIVKSAIPGIIIASLICITLYIFYKLIKKDTIKIADIDVRKVIFCIGLGLFLNAILSIFLTLLSPIIPSAFNNTLNDMLNMVLAGNPIVVLLGTGILGPIMEEIIFRHGIHRTLSRSNVIVGYVISSLLFGLAHGNLLQGAYATVLGLIFAFILTNTDNLLYPILIHITINTSSTIISFLPKDTPELLVLVIMFAISLMLIVPLIKTNSVKQLFTKTENI